jgi:hypothetical protein
MSYAPLRASAAVGAAAFALVLTFGAVTAVPAAASPAATTGPAVAAPLAPVDRAPHPAAGFGLGSDGIAPAAISLNWTASASGTFVNYTVLYSNVSDAGPWRYLTTITSEATNTLGVDNLVPGATYFWNVTAYTSALLGLGGTSATYSNVYSAVQPTLAYLTSPANTSTTINLTWTNNATYGGGIAFSSYAVVEDVDNATGLFANVTNPSARSLTVTGLPAGSSDSFYIDTYDRCSNCQTPEDSVTQSNVIVAGTATALTAAVSSTRTTVDSRVLVGFTCTPSGGTPPYAFAWNFTNGSTSFLAGSGTSSHAFSHASASGYLVRCQVTDHTGTRFVTAPVTVVVDRDPRVSASVSPVNATTGASVTFRCTGSSGTSPLTVGWTLGDGGTLPGAGDVANGTASYGSAGTYVAHCTVSDTAGGRATASFVLHISAPAAFSWVTPSVVLGVAAVVGLAVALAVLVYRRRGERAERSSAMARWLPPTGPAATVVGAKICPKCGASNVPLRRTCQACGTPLPRNPSP